MSTTTSFPKPRLCRRPVAGGLTTPETVQRVIETPDPVIRNLRITQSYHELTRAYDELLGGADRHWCAFATWASKQAGHYIRHEEVPPPLRRFLGLDSRTGRRRFVPLSPAWLLRRERFLAYARTTAADVAAHAAAGNLLVYARLAPRFARFLTWARELSHPDPVRLGEFLAALEDDSTVGSELPRAFTQYHAALFEADPKRRAERVLTANLLVGLHEQIRLQGAIEGALAAPVQRALDDPRRVWTKLPLPGALRSLGAGLFRTAFAPAIRAFETEWKSVATQCLLSLALPGQRLELGDDLPPLPDGRMFPEALSELTLPELRRVMGELDPAPGTTRGSGACDWSRLEDRMGYIAELFRSRQRERTLLEPVFTPAQVEEIYAGRVPAGRL